MSKQNKVNPGQYTQAGRLSPDDTAREMKKQRESASPTNQDDTAEPYTPAAPRVTEKDKSDEEDEPEDSSEE
jgi:hypothetical protein